MIQKTIVPDHSHLGESPVEILKIGSKGLDKTASMQKRASAFQDIIAELKPMQKKAYLHVITTGAYEYYGSQRNADAFNQDYMTITASQPKDPMHKTAQLDGGLKKYHDKSYMNGAKVYQEHKTQSEGGKPSGIVKAAKYNEEMHRGELLIQVDTQLWRDRLNKRASGQDIYLSIGCDVPKDTCFPKGTLVLTQNGYKPIQTIKIGDVVKSGDGEWHSVINTMQRQTTSLFRINTMGFPFQLECTPNHPFNVVKAHKLRSCFGAANGKKRRHTTDGSGMCLHCHKPVDLTSQWVAAGDIHQDDYLKIRVDKNAEKNTVGIAFAYLAGMYLGDGSVSFDNRSAKADPSFKVLQVASISASANPKDQDIIQKIQEAFRAATGKQARLNLQSKCRNAYIVTLQDKLLSGRILQLCLTGSYNKRITRQIFNWSLDQKAAFIAGYIDSDGSVNACKRQLRICTVNRGLAIAVQRLMWSVGSRATVCVGNNNASGYATAKSTLSYSIQTFDIPDILRKYSAKLARAQFPARLKRNGATVMLDQGFAYVRVNGVRAFQAAPVAVYNLQVEGDHTYNAQGADVHNCSVCLNQAHTLKQHCDHVTLHKNALYQDGNRACMFNDAPKFYDISGVNVPADPIAFVLNKVASGEPAQKVVKLARYVVGTRAPISLTKAAAALSKLSKIEKEIICKACDDPLFADQDQAVDDFLHAVEKYPADQVISGCNRKGLLLTPKMLFKLIGKESNNKELFDTFADKCPLCGQHLMQDMQQDPYFGAQLNDGSFDSVMPADLNLANIIQAFMPQFGVTRPALNGKAIRITIHMRPKDQDDMAVVNKMQQQEPNQEEQEEQEEKQDVKKKAALINDQFRRTYARYVIGFAQQNSEDTCMLAMQKIARFK